jgi:hypothetical protein
MARLVVLLGALASTVPLSDDDVRAAHDAFRQTWHHFRRYEAALARVAPTYDVEVEPGPPFDMFYHLEVLDRARLALARAMHESRGVWYDLARYDPTLAETRD